MIQNDDFETAKASSNIYSTERDIAINVTNKTACNIDTESAEDGLVLQADLYQRAVESNMTHVQNDVAKNMPFCAGVRTQNNSIS